MQAAAELYKNLDTDTLMSGAGAAASAAILPESSDIADGTNGRFDGALSELERDD
jgi:hypothetical protein